MHDVELRDPLFLAAALLVPVIYVLATRRVASSVQYSSLALLRGTARSLRARFARLPLWLTLAAVLSMSVALAGPRTPDATTRVRSEGIAIVMVVDRSGSMQARDLVRGDTSRNRLDVVKSLFEEFVLGGHDRPGRPDDLIGLVAFARYADGLCPLTLDHGNLVSIVRDLHVVRERSEDGTALGEGLALAVERLRKHPARSKVVILLTDGVNNAGDIEPLQAADLAKSFGIKVYAIGTGSKGLAPVPARDPFTGRTVLRPMRVEIDEDTLKEIADRTGGRYFRATDAQGLAHVYDAIDHLERSKITETRYLQYHELYVPFVTAALLLLGASALLAGTVFRRLP